MKNNIDETIKFIRKRSEFRIQQTSSTPIIDSEILAICDAIESTKKSLELLQKHLDGMAYIRSTTGRYMLFDVSGEGIVSGDTLLDMLNELLLSEK